MIKKSDFDFSKEGALNGCLGLIERGLQAGEGGEDPRLSKGN